MMQAWTKSHWLRDLATGRANNLNLLRFFAASLVILSHCYALSWGHEREPIYFGFGHLETGGSVGVLIFFSISGYLIAQSFAARNRLIPFLSARIFADLSRADRGDVFLPRCWQVLGSTVPAARF